MDDATIKNNLEKKRNELGLSQTEMARRLEISLNAYRKLEKGKTRILNEHVGKFAEKTGTSVAELVNGFEPISSATERINGIKENYDRKMRDLEDGYIKTIASLKADIERLNERLQDKDEIISMNRKGQKPESLLSAEHQSEQKVSTDLLDQDSLTRFDKRKGSGGNNRKKKKKKPQPMDGGQPAAAPAGGKKAQPKKPNPEAQAKPAEKKEGAPKDAANRPPRPKNKPQDKPQNNAPKE